MTFDPISQDPLHNPEFPADMIALDTVHQGAQLNGVVYIPVGEGQFPLILLLHGIPGYERNFDLAQILRRAGYAVCVFHYRGSWGSGGDYRFKHVLEDTDYMVNYFRESDHAARYRIDPERIILIGHSLGGWAALLSAGNTSVQAVASLSAVNIGGVWGAQLREMPDMVRPMLSESLKENLIPLQGVTSDDIVAEIEAHVDEWDLLQQVEALKTKHVLLVGAKRDDVVGVFDHHMPLVEAFKDADAARLTTALLAADHVYSSNRIELAKTILDWLKEI